MTYELSQQFKDFMIALKGWVDSGCPKPTEEQIKSGMGFRRDDSICFQIDRWTEDEEANILIDEDLQYLFKEQFEDSGFPFNKVDGRFGSSSEYDAEIDLETHYENPARVKWIKDTVASFEENK